MIEIEDDEGGDLLLTYFEPIRIYVAAIGIAIAGWAVVR